MVEIPDEDERVCATCWWWGADQRLSDNRRLCPKIAAVVGYTAHLMPTPPDFGCNQWAAREEG
jgi:hypothetical protein